MEITGRSPLRGAMGSRNWVLAAAAAAAALAGILVLTALRSARSGGGAAPVSVLVANQLIPKGSSGQAIAAGRLVRTAEVGRDSLVAGAVTDVSQLQGKVAAQDIYPGQQVSADSFAGAGGALTAQLGAADRAISVPLDAAHGMIGDVQAGDRVDVLVGFNVQGNTGLTRPVMKVLAQNVVVLKAPDASGAGATGGSGQGSGNVTLRVGDATATKLAFAVDNGKIWLVLRPGAGARTSRADAVTLQSLLTGTRPVAGGSGR